MHLELQRAMAALAAAKTSVRISCCWRFRGLHFLRSELKPFSMQLLAVPRRSFARLIVRRLWLRSATILVSNH